MKKTRTDKTSRHNDELLTEYRFDYTKAKPNRFAARIKAGSRAVVLDPDIAEAFPTPKSVNAVLRALLETMPTKLARRPRKSRTSG
jgi:hypothetical protein